jgi:hypothetical protein
VTYSGVIASFLPTMRIDPRFEAKDIKSPIQLTAAWFITLGALVGGLLVASTQAPSYARWLGPVFGLSAVLLIPLFAIAVFMLQTRYRSQLLADEYFVQAENSVRDIAARRGVELSPAQPERIARRAARNYEVLKGASILWVDDDPPSVQREQELLRNLGVVRIDTATTTEEATAMLASRPHVVISDMDRDENPKAGEELLARVGPDGPPVIIYLLDYKPELGVPDGAFGITNRPDELVDLVLDALERVQH